MKDHRIIIAAISAITIIEVTALSFGVNGTMLSIVIAAIAGLAGLSLEKPKFLKVE